MCSTCDNVKTDNDKLVKDMASLASEVKKLKDEKHAAENQILWLHENCEKLKAENEKLLNDFNSLTLKNQEFEGQMKILEDGRNVFSKNNIEKQKMINSHLQKIVELEKEGECAQKKIKELEKELESKQKSSEDLDFWIKLENKNLKANESKFQEQIKVLMNEKSVLENLKNDNEKTIKSHFGRISQLESEAEDSRNKIDELEKKLIGFVTKSDSLNFPCPKPINSVPISDCVTNFDNVKVEDCGEKSDDKKEKFQKTVLQSTKKGECSKQKPLKKKAEQKQKIKNEKIVQKDNKSSSDQSSNQNEKLQKVKNENSKNVGNKWCRSDHSAQKPNPANLRKEYHQARQCYDLGVWNNGGNWYDNRVCYSCGYQGHIAVNCQYWSYETRRCYTCNIKGHIARDCPRRSNDRLRANSQKMAKKIPVGVKPKELKASGQNVKEQKVKKPKVQETKVKLSQGQKDRLRKKRKKAREYLERILSSGSLDRSNKSSDESTPSAVKTRKKNSSDTNLGTKEEKKKEKVGDESDVPKSDKPPYGDESVSSETKEPHVGDESDSLKSDKPKSGNDSGMVKLEEPCVEVKIENSSLTMDEKNFPPLLNKNSKSPKAGQAWVKLFK
ncbi:putative transcription factor interactor and regulator CCHC(Zn) family [Helianthus annuus]|nr:putative transcription factor interactor and regulator CCHC(Zn) family [Helianthus annuus]KAJ0654780.1 putative transcription factor interactor and regulator CCHC(Zn) family [Helianthus annuus]